MANDQPDKEVRLTMTNGVPTPDQDPVEVKKAKQKVKWCADFDFRITIEGNNAIASASGGGDCQFQAKSGYFDQETRYKYTISANGVDNDPTIDVKP